MKSRWNDMDIVETREEEPFKHPEVLALFARLGDLEPKAMAEALCHLELLKTFPGNYEKIFSGKEDQSKTFFSRGLKKEMEKIYMELARHLQARSQGSQDLMNAIFDFLDDTLSFLLEVPHLISMN
jgi:hypothetical protein